LAESLHGVDAVIHLAATKEGDFHTQFAGTVVATENLLAAMAEAGVANLVAISTFSVYDYQAMAPGTLVDESSPIDRSPARRDEYARTKLVQEDLYRRFRMPDGQAPGTPKCVILRPGMIYGANNLWHALLGTGLGSRYLRIGDKAILPMTYVENCAEAMVLAAERLTDESTSEDYRSIDGTVINIVDDDLPTQGAYAAAVAERTDVPPSITVPWDAVRLGADALAAVNRRFLGDRAKFPGIAVPDRLHARFKPLRYTNQRAKELLGWTPRFGLAEAIDRSLEREADA
jgi:nucleoside-diphosphate-sugar epimerase